MQSQQRAKLQSLWETVSDDGFERVLKKHTIVPSKFLKENGIILLPYNIETHDVDKSNSSTNFAHGTPILFQPAPLDLFQRYAVDVNAFKSPSLKSVYDNYHKFDAAEGREGLRQEFWPTEFTGEVASFLEKWAFGSFPRDLPRQYRPHLPDHFEIRKPPNYPGGLYDGGRFNGKNWYTQVFEYENKPDGNPYPHVLLLSCQRRTAQKNNIMRGELAVILTAIRNRAFQKTAPEEDHEDSEIGCDEDDDEFEEFE